MPYIDVDLRALEFALEELSAGERTGRLADVVRVAAARCGYPGTATTARQCLLKSGRYRILADREDLVVPVDAGVHVET